MILEGYLLGKLAISIHEMKQKLSSRDTAMKPVFSILKVAKCCPTLSCLFTSRIVQVPKRISF